MSFTAQIASEHPVAYIIDDDDDFRRSLVLLLESAGWRVQGYPLANGFLDEQIKLKPGPLLLDLRMPGTSGLDMLEAGLIDTRRFPTVVITGHGEIESAVRSLKAGACDFLEKPFPAQDVIKSLESGLAVLRSANRPDGRHAGDFDAVGRLTRREAEVLRGLIAGLAYKVIAFRLGISARTVEMHREKLLRKLKVSTNAEAVRFAVLAGVEPMPK